MVTSVRLGRKRKFLLRMTYKADRLLLSQWVVKVGVVYSGDQRHFWSVRWTPGKRSIDNLCKRYSAVKDEIIYTTD